MLETLNNDLLPLRISWFDVLMQYFGFFSKKLCLQTNQLIQRIQHSLSNGWLNEDEANTLQQEQRTWQKIAKQLGCKQPITSPRKLYTLAKRLEKKAIRRKINEFHQFQDLLDTLNEPASWQQWQQHSKHKCDTKRHHHIWRSICDVAGLQRGQAVIVWHALDALQEHFKSIQTHRPWRFIWLKRIFYKNYLKHIKHNLKVISHLQAQIANYLYVDLKHGDPHSNKHCIACFVKLLNANLMTPLDTPPSLQDSSATPATMQSIYHVLHHSHLREKLQQHHIDIHEQLTGCMWHGQWLWLPDPINKWLCTQHLKPWHHGFIKWLQQYAITQYPSTRMICQLNLGDNKPSTINDQLTWLSKLNTSQDTISQWQYDISMLSKKYRRHPLGHLYREALIKWRTWLARQDHIVQNHLHSALEQLWRLSDQQHHRWLHTMDVIPAYHLIKNIQATSNKLVCEPITDQLQQHIKNMALIRIFFSQPDPTVAHCQALLHLAKNTKHCQTALHTMIWQSIGQHHHFIRKQLTNKLYHIIKPTYYPEPLTGAVYYLSLLIEILSVLSDEPWALMQLNMMLLCYLNTQAVYPNHSLASSSRAQMMEDILCACLGHTVYLGQTLTAWMSEFKKDRCHDAWQSYRFKAKQLYTAASKKIWKQWIHNEIDDFDRSTKTWLSTQQEVKHLNVWYEQCCQTIHNTKNKTPSPTLDMILPTSDSIVLKTYDAIEMPLHRIIKARICLWSFEQHTQQEIADGSNLEHAKTHISTITTLLAPLHQNYPCLQLHAIEQMISMINIIHHHSHLTENKKGQPHEDSTTTQTSMF
jgi:hypothetical protein